MLPLKPLGEDKVFLDLWQHNRNLCLHLHMAKFPLMRTPFIGFRAHTNSVWLYFNLITSVKTLFPNKLNIHRFYLDMNFEGTLFSPICQTAENQTKQNLKYKKKTKQKWQQQQKSPNLNTFIFLIEVNGISVRGVALARNPRIILDTSRDSLCLPYREPSQSLIDLSSTHTSKYILIDSTFHPHHDQHQTSSSNLSPWWLV